MTTQPRILSAVAGHLIELAALAALLTAPLGTVPGILAALAALTTVSVTYLSVLRPRLVRWGATDEEAAWPMPGDNIAAPGGRCTTRAVTIGAPAGQVWPWMAQLGYGRAGWYTDHLSHAGRKRSAAQTRPECQQLAPGDRILIMPGSGLDVIAAEDGHYFAARTPDGTMSWCLEVKPVDQHSCRLISRWRASWLVTAASAPWTALCNPSSFVTERRMLLGIKLRAEKAAQPGLVPSRRVLRRPVQPGQGDQPRVKSWINYDGTFYRSGLRFLAWRINEHLARWACTSSNDCRWRLTNQRSGGKGYRHHPDLVAELRAGGVPGPADRQLSAG